MNVFANLTASYQVASERNETIIRDTFLTFISGNSSFANLTLNSSNLAIRSPETNLALRSPETNVDEPQRIAEANIEVPRFRRNDGYSFSAFANDGLFIPRQSESTNIAATVLDFTINSPDSTLMEPVNLTFSVS